MKKKSIDQLFLRFEQEKPVSDNKNIKGEKSFQPLDLKRAALGWLVSQVPNAVGVRVPTRISKFCADIAAFWVGSRRGQIIPRKTMIIETRSNREECWPDCSKHEGLLKQLKEKKLALQGDEKQGLSSLPQGD
ncbi:MAG: hypothetical protein NT118_00140 [Lentisphaerae bacterium]|nr:hypothetical protein [Lentisphaerota bacterium]